MKNFFLPFFLAVLLFGGFSLFLIKKSQKTAPKEEIKSFMIDQAAKARQTGQAWTKGNTDSKIVLTEFSDFQCPACAQWARYVDSIVEENQNKIKFEYRHFPLTRIHRNAFAAAAATEAAGRQGKFWQMYEKLFTHQSQWSDAIAVQSYFKQYAKELELNLDQFTADLNSEDIKKIVEDDAKKAKDLDLPGTPTFLLNGELIEPNNPQNLREMIKNAIQSEIN